MVAVGQMAGKSARPINRNRIPGCTYTEPGIGSVGLTEAQAKAQGFEVKVGKFPFAGNSKATILGTHEGFVKVIADAKLGEILGVHIIGPSAYELIAEAVTAMEAEATVESMMATIHAHPTLYEALGEAFQRCLRSGHQCIGLRQSDYAALRGIESRTSRLAGSVPDSTAVRRTSASGVKATTG